MITAKGIFFSTGKASFSKLRKAFLKIPKADFGKFSILAMCVVTSATMSKDNMLQLVSRGQANGHMTGLGRPDPGHRGAPKGPTLQNLWETYKDMRIRVNDDLSYVPLEQATPDRTGCDTDGPEKKSCLTDFENNLAQNRFCPG